MHTDIYRKLQQHLNRMPVGFPRTLSGVEIRILKRLFTPQQATIALLMGSELEPLEVIRRRAGDGSFLNADLESELKEMARKGAIMNVHRNRREHYALVPFVVGMFEFQLGGLTPEMYRDTVAYFKSGYGLEYLSTAVPQTRVVPIRRSLDGGHNVATYDEIRTLVEGAGGRVGLAPCICRKGRDLVGKPCRKTDRREVCLALREMFDHGRRQGWVQPISSGAALDLLDQNEKQGLVLQPSNEQQPQFVCSCCGCCCGILGMLKTLPKPAEFTAANFQAAVDAGTCNGCGVCLKRCQVGAVNLGNDIARVDLNRCIGCGVCVPTCKQGALRLIPKREPVCPPATTEALYEVIGGRKSGLVGRVKTGIMIVRQRGGMKSA